MSKSDTKVATQYPKLSPARKKLIDRRLTTQAAANGAMGNDPGYCQRQVAAIAFAAHAPPGFFLGLTGIGARVGCAVRHAL